MVTLFMMNSFGINGDILQQCVAPGRPITFPMEMWPGGGVVLEQQHLPGPNTQLQVLLVSKAVPDSPLGDSVLVATVLEGPEASAHPSLSCQQPISGQGLAGAPL